MEVTAEHLLVGDKVLASEHAGLVGGKITHVEEAFAHLYTVAVVGGENINPGGKLKVIIKLTSAFVVERA